jgi:hypothetical protein
MYVFSNNMAEILCTEHEMNVKRHIIALFHAIKVEQFRARTPSKSSIYHYMNENSILGNTCVSSPTLAGESNIDSSARANERRLLDGTAVTVTVARLKYLLRMRSTNATFCGYNHNQFSTRITS